MKLQLPAFDFEETATTVQGPASTTVHIDKAEAYLVVRIGPTTTPGSAVHLLGLLAAKAASAMSKADFKALVDRIELVDPPPAPVQVQAPVSTSTPAATPKRPQLTPAAEKRRKEELEGLECVHCRGELLDGDRPDKALMTCSEECAGIVRVKWRIEHGKAPLPDDMKYLEKANIDGPVPEQPKVEEVEEDPGEPNGGG